MLNQVNLEANNNKFYVIQLLEKNGQLKLFTRYGRVGEIGKPETKPGSVKELAKLGLENRSFGCGGPQPPP